MAEIDKFKFVNEFHPDESETTDNPKQIQNKQLGKKGIFPSISKNPPEIHKHKFSILLFLNVLLL